LLHPDDVANSADARLSRDRNPGISIRTKITLFIAAPTLVLYVAILGGTLVFLRHQAFKEVEQHMTRLAFPLRKPL